MKLYLSSYASNSESAKRVAEALGATLCTYNKCPVHGDKAWPTPYDDNVVVNWGSDRHPRWYVNGAVYNTAIDVVVASNKAITFEVLKDHNIPAPDFTYDQRVARAWATDGSTVIGRTTYHGSRGNNIVVLNDASTDRQWNKCVLFTKHIRNVAEYRAHVVNGEMVLLHRKRRRTGRVYPSNIIKNYESGWVFCRTFETDDRINSIACRAIRAVGLDFGAVDIVYNRHRDTYYVLEINTAPNLTGESLEVVTHAIKKMINPSSEGVHS